MDGQVVFNSHDKENIYSIISLADRVESPCDSSGFQLLCRTIKARST